MALTHDKSFSAAEKQDLILVQTNWLTSLKPDIQCEDFIFEFFTFGWRKLFYVL